MKIPSVKLVNRRSYLIERCVGQSVLHLGCAGAPNTLRDLEAGTHLHHLMGQTARHLAGVDMDVNGIETMRQYGIKNLVCGDVCDLSNVMRKKEFDVVVCGELIEHIQNPGQFLSSLQKICSTRATVLLTTPNAHSVKSWLHCLLGQDATDRDHVAVYSFSTLNTLLVCNGFSIDRWSVGMVTQQSRRSMLLTPIVKACISVMPRLGDSLVVEFRRVVTCENDSTALSAQTTC